KPESNNKTITGPYITTVLSTSVMLNPRQLDNSIYINLKKNLIEKIEGKCYKNYGFVTKIYKILEYSEGVIVPENPMAGVLFNVKFTCRLCNPLKNTEIVCKIQKMKGMLINAINGPITVIITMDRLNDKIFYHE